MKATPKNMKRFVLLCPLVLTACAVSDSNVEFDDDNTASAEQPIVTTIFSDTFDSGTSGWTLTGTATTTTSPRLGASGNSVKLPLRSTVSRVISTTGYGGISVTMNMAASSLESGIDRCVAEYSVNKGASYIPLLTLLDGQDNSVFNSVTFALPASADNNPNFAIRYRASGDAGGDYCYGETVTVTGTAASFPSPPAPVMATTYDSLAGTGNVTRTLLTYAQLTGGSQIAGPVDSAAFDLPVDAANPTNYFQGPLESLDQATIGSATSVRDDYSYLAAPERSHLPKLYFEFISHGSHMVPVARTYQQPEHPFWEFVAQPGRVWNEASDNGYSRVSMPFALTQKNANCVHNGEMTFLFKTAADGQSIASISKAYYQIVQETCLYFKANFWGTMTVSATTSTVNNAPTIRASYENEVANRLPVKDIAQLAVDFPGTNTALIGSEQTAAHRTAFGVVVDNTLYRGGFQTRYGTYGFKDVMALPSYSTSKAFMDSFGAMRIAQKYPALNFYANSIASRVPSCPSATWGDVSISNALDMATGNYGLAGYEADEGSIAMTNDYFLRETQAEKLNFACTKYARKATPGTFWNYHTPDHYLTAVAERQAISVQEPATGTLAQFLTNEIYAPLNLSPLTAGPKTTYDSVAQEWGAYGEILTLDDFAKLAKFANGDEGIINGVQVLDYARLKQALQRDSANQGLVVTVPNNNFPHRYKAGFWSIDVYGGAYPATNCNGPHEPYMSGYGGIGAALLKSKLNYIFASDNAEYAMDTTLNELAAHVRAPCATTYRP